MAEPPRIGPRKASERFERYAQRHREAVGACASLLSLTRDPVQRARYEKKLQRNREAAAFYEAKAREASDMGG
jgi:hypothetical protein